MKIVSIGASAGGLEAVRDFLTHLAPDTGAAFVVVQNSPADAFSTAATALEAVLGMPVLQPQSSTRPRPDHIYLKAPDKNLWFERDVLHVGPRNLSEPVYLPVDRLFLSMAQAEEAVAVILSGQGDDGSRGARYVKEWGGAVLVQSPASALYHGMPEAALRSKAADLTGTPAELAVRLNFFLKNQQADQDQRMSTLATQENGQLLAELLRRIREVSGINFVEYREDYLLRRLLKRMLLKGMTSFKKFARQALRDEQELHLISDDFLSSATAFFRHPETFRKLRELVLPQILRPGAARPVRVWVPACSTGEEAYSLAILIEEYLREQRLQLDYKIFASDIDRDAIRFAGEGRYAYSIAADVPTPLLNRYFEREAQTCQVSKRLRERILFAVHNTLEAPPFTRLDLISCRNFLIYLQEETRRRVLTTFHFALDPEGYLLLGPNEHPGELRHAFATLNRRWNIYQKREALRPPAAGRQAHANSRSGQVNDLIGETLEQKAVDPEQVTLLRQRIERLEEDLHRLEEKARDVLRQVQESKEALDAARRELLVLLSRQPPEQ